MPANLTSWDPGLYTAVDNSDKRPSLSLGYLIDINTSPQEIFETLRGIGPTIPAAMISYHLAEGKIETIEEIQKAFCIG